MSQNNPNWVPPWHSPSLTPPSVSPWVERLFFWPGREKRGWKKWERPLICSLCFSLLSLFISLSSAPSLFSALSCLSPLPLPFFHSSLSTFSLPSSYRSLCLFFCPLLKLSWFRELDWSHGGILGCPYGTVISWNWLLGASRLGDLCRCSAGLQGIRKSLWYRHQVLVCPRPETWIAQGCVYW